MLHQIYQHAIRKSDMLQPMTLTDKELGENVRRFRGGMSQKALAELMTEMGVRWSQPTVAAIERGERALKLTEAVTLADVLRMPVTHFINPGMGAQVIQRAQTALMSYEKLKAAIGAYEDARLQLAATLDEIAPSEITTHHQMLGESWIERGVLDVIEEMREEQGADKDGGEATGAFADPEGHPWMTLWASKYSGAGIDG